MAACRVASATSPRGELVLSRRDDGALELRVNGVFVMDSAETSAERALAHEALDRSGSNGPLRVLVAGLGLGFTLAAVLDHPEVASVTVVEIEPELVRWHRNGSIPQTRHCLDDPRVRLVVEDLAAVLTALPRGSVDVLLFDVDNGPGHLVYDGNAALYQTSVLSRAADALSARGVLAIWCADLGEELRANMTEVLGEVTDVTVPVSLGARTSTYTVVLGRKEKSGSSGADPRDTVGA